MDYRCIKAIMHEIRLSVVFIMSLNISYYDIQSAMIDHFRRIIRDNE